jgi:hypothetical protein
MCCKVREPFRGEKQKVEGGVVRLPSDKAKDFHG